MWKLKRKFEFPPLKVLILLGVESRAVVEFAPYQRIPKEHKTTDVRQGTIDEDQDYLDFLESLKAEDNSLSEAVNEADGLTQIERLENRIAMVTGNYKVMIFWHKQWY
jgi:hypothetical protein